MCMSNMKAIDHDRLITVYKIVLRLTNGKFVAMKNHIDKKLPEYIYTIGTNTPLKGTLGLHSYQSKEVACEYAKMITAYCGMHKKFDNVESACVMYCTIPADSNTKIGNHWKKEHVGYISTKLTFDPIPCKEYLTDQHDDENHNKWSTKLKELGLF
jgi:hypothetical protein